MVGPVTEAHYCDYADQPAGCREKTNAHLKPPMQTNARAGLPPVAYFFMLE